MKILFLVPYPLGEAPSQRFRFEQYFKLLLENGISYQVQSFLSSQNWSIMYSNGNLLKKVIALTKGFAKRLFMLIEVNSYDFVFIHREAAPIGPPIIEWIITKVLKKKIIYDFDDAIWATDSFSEGRIEKMMRWRGKVKTICRWSHKISCGNEYLCSYAKQFNQNVILNPTTIDTEYLHKPKPNKHTNANTITIGWTGSHSTLKYLNALVPAIKKLEKKYPQLLFLVIANKRPDINMKSFVYLPWSITTEIEDLKRIDIGVMPLPDDEWSKGKCGFKLLQYMSLNIPALASPVGVNTKIIRHSDNGMLCFSEKEWISNLELLINNQKLRSKLAITGRTTVETGYSVSSNSRNFLSLFM